MFVWFFPSPIAVSCCFCWSKWNGSGRWWLCVMYCGLTAHQLFSQCARFWSFFTPSPLSIPFPLLSYPTCVFDLFWTLILSSVFCVFFSAMPFLPHIWFCVYFKINLPSQTLQIGMFCSLCLAFSNPTSGGCWILWLLNGFLNLTILHIVSEHS